MNCGTSTIKRNSRRTKGEIARLRAELYRIVEENRPATVRQVFYLAVARGLIPKEQSAYRNTVCRLLATMRIDRELPYGWIADHTRWMRKPASYNGLKSCLELTAKTYRRSLWNDQSSYVEIWLEKDALAGICYSQTKKYDVPLMVTRGYPSLSFLYEGASAIRASKKPSYLYYFGDRDPSGLDIPRAVEHRLRKLAPESEIHFMRMAVTAEQISEFKLPSRPTKKTDSRSGRFAGESVELDSIPPAELRSMIAKCIEIHIDKQALRVTEVAERSERQALSFWASISTDQAA